MEMITVETGGTRYRLRSRPDGRADVALNQGPGHADGVVNDRQPRGDDEEQHDSASDSEDSVDLAVSTLGAKSGEVQCTGPCDCNGLTAAQCINLCTPSEHRQVKVLCKCIHFFQ